MSPNNKESFNVVTNTEATSSGVEYPEFNPEIVICKIIFYIFSNFYPCNFNTVTI